MSKTKSSDCLDVVLGTWFVPTGFIVRRDFLWVDYRAVHARTRARAHRTRHAAARSGLSDGRSRGAQSPPRPPTQVRELTEKKGLGAAMRGAMDGDVAAERQLNAIKDLLEVLPRSRGFRVSLDGNVSVYPATQRASVCQRKGPAAARVKTPFYSTYAMQPQILWPHNKCTKAHRSKKHDVLCQHMRMGSGTRNPNAPSCPPSPGASARARTLGHRRTCSAGTARRR